MLRAVFPLGRPTKLEYMMSEAGENMHCNVRVMRGNKEPPPLTLARILVCITALVSGNQAWTRGDCNRILDVCGPMAHPTFIANSSVTG